MRASAIAYWAAKQGSADAEYEDAWYVLPGLGDEVPGDWAAVAVADGATESLLARQWATMVTRRFAEVTTAAHDPHSFADTATELSAQWPGVVSSYLAERKNAGRPLRWYERPGIEKGAFATLLTFQAYIDREVRPGRGSQSDPHPLSVIGRWYSAALGDTCLFHVRGGRLQISFPMSESADFDTSPALLGSCNSAPDVIRDRVRFAAGTVAEGDDFFVCTDALAAWFLARTEEGGQPWETLRDLSDIGFSDWVAQARVSGGLRNDDVTLIHVDIW